MECDKNMCQFCKSLAYASQTKPKTPEQQQLTTHAEREFPKIATVNTTKVLFLVQFNSWMTSWKWMFCDVIIQCKNQDLSHHDGNLVNLISVVFWFKALFLGMGSSGYSWWACLLVYSSNVEGGWLKSEGKWELGAQLSLPNQPPTSFSFPFSSQIARRNLTQSTLAHQKWIVWANQTHWYLSVSQAPTFSFVPWKTK